MSTFPAGLSSPWGILESNPFLFESSLTRSQWTNRRRLWLEALWLKGLDVQLKRHWPIKLIFKMEDLRIKIWSALKTLNTFSGDQLVTLHAHTVEGEQKKKQFSPFSWDHSDAWGWTLKSALFLTLSPPPIIKAPILVDPIQP
jgi:hypothetical protein